ncbi:MAG: penicillin-binding transpeptidase domain-containing protein [Pseudomonadota bacterium]
MALSSKITRMISARYYGQNLELNAPYIAEAAREEAIALYGDKAYTNGYKIYTTVDSKLQSAAQQAVVKGLLNYDNRHGYRGPEQQLDFSILEPLASDQANVQTESMNDNTAEPLGAVNFIPWLDILKQIPRHNILEPAAVVSIREKSISALMATGETVDVPWENGISKALPFVNENFAGPQPQSPADVVKLGDVIRIYKDEDKGWYFSQSPNIEAALVAINPEDGAIRSMVGGFDFSKSSFNRASQAKRQPGSNFKPFIYTVGIEQGLTPATIFNDAPIVVDDARLESSWRPENASGKFYGPTRMRKALFLSRNLVSIRLLRSLGIASTVSAMERFGMDIQSIPRDLSMALGSHIMSPIEIATGYSTFANGGFKIEPYLVHHIRDRHDNVLRSAKPKVVPGSQATLFKVDASTEGKADTDSLEDTVADTDSTVFTLSTRSLTDKLAENLNQQHNQGEKLVVELDSQIAERVIDERISYIINSMLKDVIKRGTGKRAQALGRNDLAGKTGTTNGPIDAWFSGYNRKMVTTTWVGFDNNQKLGRGEYGGVAALPIWIDYMQAALDNVPETNFPQPDGIVTVRINPETGERALPSDPNGIFELFLEENAPRERPVGQTPGNSSDNPAPEDLF